MTLHSPLRYPGGKSRLASLLGDIITLNCLENCEYFEPFAGGAGAALALLGSRMVSQIHLNDADPRIYAFWRSCTRDSERFAKTILETKVTIETWRRCRSVCRSPGRHKLFEVGFSTFFLNRCNRSGVICGAGPIGGYAQSGKWRLDVRFNRQELASRIIQIGRFRDKITVTNLDALEFLKKKLPRDSTRSHAFLYLDPPYVQKGQRLYLNYYEQDDHRELCKYLKSQKQINWIASYDDSPLIRDLYRQFQVCHLPIQYSLQVKRVASELVIAPRRVFVPAVCRRTRGTAI